MHVENSLLDFINVLSVYNQTFRMCFVVYLFCFSIPLYNQFEFKISIMKSTISIVVLSAALLFVSCKSNSKYTPETYSDQMMTFGNMGGFAGTVNSYTVLENGQFFKRKPRSESLVAIADLKKREAKQIFANFKTLGIADMEIDDPGNLTYFIEYKNGDEMKKLKWGGSNVEVPKNLHLFFTNMMLLAGDKAKTGKAEEM